MWSGTYLPGRWPDAFWLAGYWTVARAAYVQRRDALTGRWRPMPALIEIGMPYASLLLSFVALVLVAHLDQASMGLLWATVGITVLVMTRQLAVLRQNGRLLAASQALTEELRRSENRFRSLVQNSSDVITIVEGDGAIRYVSPAVHRLLGYEPQDLTGTRATELVHPDDVQTALGVLEKGRVSRVQVRLRHRDGSWRYTESTFNNLVADPGVAGIVINLRDVTERLELEERLVHQAYHDTLTNLANRALLREQLVRALQARRRGEAGPAIIFLDLDGFKTVNDSLGHAAGDLLLVAVADRLHSWLGEYGTVARLGGDEFAVLLEAVGRADASLLAERALAALEAPFTVGGREVYVGASIGVALAGTETDTADILLRNADAAMYRAKRSGKGNVTFYAPDMHHEAFQRLEMEADLRRALEHEEFVVHYQPTVDLGSGEIAGVEALVRWNHPERGMIPPADFIPMAEETGLIVPLGRWVLQTACRDLRRWNQRGNGARKLRLAVNLSVRQLSDPQLIEDVARAVKENGLQPGALVLEVTESLLLEGQESMVRIFAQLKELGVRIAIDDFGTGYSSFGYLRRLPVDILKIDRSFVQGLGGAPGDVALVQAMVEMARTLGFVTVAEGVERADQAAVLQSLHCHQGQGFYFARPTDADTVSSLLSQTVLVGGG
jgi:diguanylate cyclase (GGDEF)-like protein/PAS domain S-box-containing protein